MTLGFLPPISRESFLKAGLATRAISAPVRVLPVKEMADTLGCLQRAAPAVLPNPCTMFKTPGGRPANRHSLASRKAVMGVISDGLATTQLPAASAGATFQVKRYRGKFQGEMQPTT